MRTEKKDSFVFINPQSEIRIPQSNLSFADGFCYARSSATRRLGGCRVHRHYGRERRWRLYGYGARTTASAACFGALLFGCYDSLGLLNSLSRHKLVAQFHLLRDLVDVLSFCAALSATYYLFVLKQLCLIVFSNPDVKCFGHLSFHL